MTNYDTGCGKGEDGVKSLVRGGMLILLVLLPAGMFGSEAATVTLSPYADTVAKIIKFDRRILIMMKQESGGSIHRLIGYDENNFQIIVDGVVVPVPEDRTEKVLSSLRKKLVPLKYMAFVVEMNGNIRTDKIGVLKGTDQFEILRLMHTDGKAYNISHEDVIDRLREWKKKYPFDIIGAEKDWIEIEFKKLPDNLQSFAEEVYDFCPDAVDQGPGSTAGLAREIQQTKSLFLRWEKR
jgi:hypothetical protein